MIDPHLTDAFAAFGQLDHQNPMPEKLPERHVVTKHPPRGPEIERAAHSGRPRRSHQPRIGGEVIDLGHTEPQALGSESNHARSGHVIAFLLNI
ncbi:hypothetical protein ATY77_29080 [Rhizobium sp. R634]|nr:hypothetical protein ATY77_29080 [Rhizobium sp. R634]